MRLAVLLVVLAVSALVLTSAVATAVDGQEPSPAAPTSSTTAAPTTTDQVPTNDIVPKPNSGAPPNEAGDRGGALQLGLLGLVVVVIAAVVAMLVRQSRRARDVS